MENLISKAVFRFSALGEAKIVVRIFCGRAPWIAMYSRGTSSIWRSTLSQEAEAEDAWPQEAEVGMLNRQENLYPNIDHVMHHGVELKADIYIIQAHPNYPGLTCGESRCNHWSDFHRNPTHAHITWNYDYIYLRKILFFLENIWMSSWGMMLMTFKTEGLGKIVKISCGNVWTSPIMLISISPKQDPRIVKTSSGNVRMFLLLLLLMSSKKEPREEVPQKMS